MKKINPDDLKEKVKKTKKKLNHSIEDQSIKTTRKIDDLDKKISGNLADLEVVVKDVEKKIQDYCETLLQKRINNEYIEGACKVLEERLRKVVK